MTGEWDELLKLVCLSGVRRFTDLHIVRLGWSIRVTSSGQKIWSPRAINQLHDLDSFQQPFASVRHGDVILIFRRYRLKLVGVALSSQMPTSCDKYLSTKDSGGKGCFILVKPLFVAPVDQVDNDDHEQDESEDDGSEHKRKVLSLPVIEQIRLAQVDLGIAHEELSAGRKKGNWGWWVFPCCAIVYGDRGIKGIEDAMLVLRDAELGRNYRESVKLAWSQIVEAGQAPSELMGSDTHADELRSSLELFLEAWKELDNREKELPEMREFILHVRNLLDFIDPKI
jgi:uncharacterized protein (DUF1810 family)